MVTLSPTETAFLSLYDRGQSYKEICSTLDVSLSTAKTIGHHIVAKTAATCLRQAAYILRLVPDEICN